MAITTKFWTRGQLISKVEKDLDLEDEDFVQPAEMQGYLEEAIDETEKMVHRLYEDYFLSRSTFPIVSGTDEYGLPPNIFAHKIRRLTFKLGGKVYVCARIRDWKKFEDYMDGRESSGGTDELRYFTYNAVAGSPKILFTPVPTEAGATITVWYLRQANRPEADSEIMDIPEASTFVIQYIKVRCYEKEGHPNLGKAMNDLDILRSNLELTLTDMVPDDETDIEMDLDIYREMS